MRRVICNETQWLGAFAEPKAARAWRTLLRVAPGTHMGPRAEWSAFDIFKTATTADPPKTFNASSRTANYGPRGSSIRKNIIGHRMRSVFVRLGCGKRFGSAGAARQSPCGDWRRGSTAKAQSFEGSFVKPTREIPKVVAFSGWTRIPPGETTRKDSNVLVTIVNGTERVGRCGKLWKTSWFENQPGRKPRGEILSY